MRMYGRRRRGLGWMVDATGGKGRAENRGSVGKSLRDSSVGPLCVRERAGDILFRDVLLLERSALMWVRCVREGSDHFHIIFLQERPILPRNNNAIRRQLHFP